MRGSLERRFHEHPQVEKEAVFDDTECRKWKTKTSAKRITDFVFMVAISVHVGDLVRVVELPAGGHPS